jgi:hypothetical protein
MQTRGIPLKYLGLHVDKSSLLNNNWWHVEEKLGCYQEKMLDIGARTILLSFCITATVFNMLSLIISGSEKDYDMFKERIV